MTNKKKYEKTKLYYINLLEDRKLSIEEKFEKLNLYELIEKTEIYQAELQAQNDELIEKELLLIKQKEKFQNLYNFAPIAYLQLNNQSQIMNFNEEALKLLRVSTNDIQKMNSFLKYLDNDSKIEFLQILFDLDSGNIIHKELKFMNGNDLIYGLVSIKKNTSLGCDYMISIIDITEKKKQETILIEESKNSIIGEMLRMIIHQWKQPLNLLSIIGSSLSYSMHNEKIDFNSIDKLTGTIIDQVEYMNETINHYKDFFSKSSQKSIVGVKRSIDKTITFTSAMLKNSDINLHVSYENNSEECEIDAFKNDLCQILISIITNAKDELENKDYEKNIWLNVTNDEDYIYIKIKNNGGLISKNIIDFIFEKDISTKKNKNGSGLGLYIVKKIVDDHLKAEVQVKNIPDENSVEFYLKIKKNIHI